MPPKIYSRQFERVLQAAKILEPEEEEYTLDDLAGKSGLTREDVLMVLKEYWIDSDGLDIVYLDLNEREEKQLYHYHCNP